MQMPYYTFYQSYLYTDFLLLTVFQLIVISYAIPFSKYGFTIFTSKACVNYLPSQFLIVQWRFPTLFTTRYDPRSMACSVFLRPSDDTETLPPGLKTR